MHLTAIELAALLTLAALAGGLIGLTVGAIRNRSKGSRASTADARARKLLARGEDVDAVLEALSRGITQKMLHGALAELRAGDLAARERASAAVQHFFLRKER